MHQVQYYIIINRMKKYLFKNIISKSDSFVNSFCKFLRIF